MKPNFALAELSLKDRVKVTGFARLVGGYLDTDQAAFLGYKDSVSFAQESLFAVQLDASLTDTVSFTTQLLAHQADNRSSSIEWAYLTYAPNRNWQARLGRQRTPFYSYSDVLDVGYAYPYITAPIQIYSSNLFTNYDGLNLRYQTSFKDVLFSGEGFWGSYDEALVFDDYTISPDVDDLRGLILGLTYSNFSARMGHYTGKVSFHIPGLEPLIEQLRQFNFNQSADSLLVKDNVKVNHFGLAYKSLTWFAELEATSIETNSLTIADIDGVSILGGYQFENISLFGYLANVNNEFAQPLNEIPTGLDPGLDQLAFAYQSVFQQLGADDLRSYSLGIRYDFPNSMALKGTITRLVGESDKRSSFRIQDPLFDRKANLYQVSLEWAF